MANRKRSLSQRTEDAANAKQNAHMQGRNGTVGLRQAGARRQARNTSEALGMGFREFILPMIIQGANELKANYDQRGENKTQADILTERLRRGEELSAGDQVFLEGMIDKYKDNPAYAGRWGMSTGAPQDAAQQPAPQPAPQAEGINAEAVRSGLLGYAFGESPQNATVDSPFALTGANLAQNANQSLQDALGGQNPALANLLNPQSDNDEFLRNLAGRYWR